MKTLIKTLSICLLLCSCSNSSTQLPETSKKEEAKPPASQTKTLSQDERIAGVRGLLQARHIVDLPSKAVLDHREDAAGSLRWLATQDKIQAIRVRALTLLRHYPDDATAAILIEVAQSETERSGIRAAALRGMVGFDLSEATIMRNELSSRLGAEDPMLAVAAVQTLATQESTIELVRQAAADEKLPKVTRDAAVTATQ